MATADEIRKWAVGQTRKSVEAKEKGTLLGDGELLFHLPVQPSDRPGTAYLRCVQEQRVIVEIEIAAQLAELNQLLREVRDVISVIGQHAGKFWELQAQVSTRIEQKRG